MKRSVNVVSRGDVKKAAGGGKDSGDATAFICGTIGAILYLIFGH